jgi:two-component system sensor histidine kinase MtrB
MKIAWRRVSLPPMTIRTLVVVWAIGILSAWTMLVAGWFVAKSRLSAIDRRVALDVRALDTAHELDLAILAQRREDLLWEATGRQEYRQRAYQYLETAERTITDLRPYINMPEEHDLVARIQREMKTLRAQSQSPTLRPSQVAPKLNELLSTVHRFTKFNQDQMAESIQAAERLHGAISDWAVGLSVGTAVLLSLGSWSIIRRVVRPTLTLARAARAFGSGDLAVRAPVLYHDEVGALAWTFNDMAADIADREKERLRFVAMVAHDLKNPVLAMEMATRLLRRSAADEQATRTYLDAMEEEMQRLRTVVRDLTDDVQVASGHLSLQRALVDLGVVVRQLIQAQATAWASHQVVVETALGCMVLGDARRLERVVQNLVSNAVKYSPRHTRVTVRVEKEDRFTLLTVSDQGRGIAPEDLQVIFQPFGRGRSADMLAEGTGLGLYVVKQIVEAHGGRIEVESKPGQGATFRVSLPLAQEQCLPGGNFVAAQMSK